MYTRTHSTPVINRKEGIFGYLLLLTAFFFLFEISFFILCNKTYLSDFDFVSSHLSIPVTIIPGILFFIAVQIALHLVFCLLAWLIAAPILLTLRLPSGQHLNLAITIWLWCIITMMLANQYYYPNTKMAELLGIFIPNQTVAKCSLIFFLIPLSLSLFFAFGYWLQYLYRFSNRFFAIGLILISAATFLVVRHEPRKIEDAASSTKPNIIFVGIDSLRPDFLSYFGSERKTPFFDDFLNGATVFSEAVTPLARTFPSWTGILTGQYPREIGVRYNLATVPKNNLVSALPVILQRAGYRTIYATDEVRFSNVDKSFGFDRLITPPIGLNDFLVGTFNDFPLSNLFVNSKIGRVIFPYSYANRPVFFTYEPNSFLQMLQSMLKHPRHQPIFLAVHFCLPHHPYLWADLPATKFSAQERYAESVLRVDRQINDFFALLRRYELLNHAIVVVLSDHGEALELPGDRITEHDLYVGKGKPPQFYPASLDHQEINQTAGHGTDVLGLPQYHTLLAFRTYGLQANQAKSVSGVVSLLDIKPTLLDFLSLTSSDVHGQSLRSYIWGKKTQVTQHQPVFLESDYTPDAIRTVYPETRQVLLEGIQLFQIDPKTTRLTVKPKMGEMIIHSKQYANIYDGWMLALYPQNQNVRMPILINLKTGLWTNDLTSTFAAHSPARHMMQDLKAFYGEEINSIN